MEFAISIATAFAKATAPIAELAWKSLGQRAFNDLIVQYTKAFQPFVEASMQRCAHIRTIIDRNASVELDAIYVAASVSDGMDHSISDERILSEVLSFRRNLLITGTAGAGKSVVLRWLTLRLGQSLPEHQRIPLFCEVRDIDFSDIKEGLDAVVFKFARKSRSTLTLDRFQAGLQAGLFVILLDGLDEAPIAFRAHILKAIDEFGRDYSATTLLVSSRPDPPVEHLQTLRKLTLNPLNLEQALEIVRKSSFTDEKKNEFSLALDDGLFQKNKDLLSIPLMVLVMMLTYDSVGSIPEKTTLFYEQAYSALFLHHDASKGRRFRQRHTDLEIDEFGNLFSYFSAITYFKEKYSLSRIVAVETIRKSANALSFDCKAESYLEDCLISVCLLIDDNGSINFSHRSFQEYFTARFLASYSGTDFDTLLESLVPRSNTDSVFGMLRELAKEKLFSGWAIGKADKILDELRILNRSDPKAIRAVTMALCNEIGLNRKSADIVTVGMIDRTLLAEAILISRVAHGEARPHLFRRALVRADELAKLSPEVRERLFSDDGLFRANLIIDDLPDAFFLESEILGVIDDISEYVEEAKSSMVSQVGRVTDFASLFSS